MNNIQFLEIIKKSFLTFLNTGSRSNAKLKILHGAIANDLSQRLGSDFTIKSLGFANDKEGKIQGRYINKNVDITIYKDDKPIAGIGVKFVMQNYAQNSNNYFENMLGETANIRSNNIPYFQIFIIPEKLPYYKQGGVFGKWETFSTHHIKKYLTLSFDKTEISIHTPSKSLIYIIQLPDITNSFVKNSEYNDFYKNLSNFDLSISKTDFGTLGDNVILNDYEHFIEKVKHRILSI